MAERFQVTVGLDHTATDPDDRYIAEVRSHGAVLWDASGPDAMAAIMALCLQLAGEVEAALDG